eukprot:5880399-Lingulodinium_polyedra.AAC.1
MAVQAGLIGPNAHHGAVAVLGPEPRRSGVQERHAMLAGQGCEERSRAGRRVGVGGRARGASRKSLLRRGQEARPLVAEPAPDGPAGFQPPRSHQVTLAPHVRVQDLAPLPGAAGLGAAQPHVEPQL